MNGIFFSLCKLVELVAVIIVVLYIIHVSLLSFLCLKMKKRKLESRRRVFKKNCNTFLFSLACDNIASFEVKLCQYERIQMRIHGKTLKRIFEFLMGSL